jgi:glycosyltransferase involved in cell wall biosynthesis
MPHDSQWPSVSIVIPSYDSAPFLEEAIRSVLLQGYPAIELLVMDGGSSDGSVAIIEKYEPWLSGWVSEPDRGQSHAVNKGVLRATAEKLLWLNADDLCLPGAFAAAATGFAHPTAPVVVVGQAKVIDSSGIEIAKLHSRFTNWHEYASRKNTIRQVSTFFRRDVFLEAGLLDESLRYSMDRDLLLRMTKKYTPHIVDDYLTAFRNREDSRFHGSLVDGYRESDEVTARYLSSQPWRNHYREWSALHWLFLAKSPAIPTRHRFRCVYYAVAQHPGIFSRRSFWKHAAEWLRRQRALGNDFDPLIR